MQLWRQIFPYGLCFAFCTAGTSTLSVWLSGRWDFTLFSDLPAIAVCVVQTLWTGHSPLRTCDLPMKDLCPLDLIFPAKLPGLPLLRKQLAGESLNCCPEPLDFAVLDYGLQLTVAGLCPVILN